MTLAAQTTHTTAQPMSWLARSEAWLDSKGKGAWIAAVVLGLIFAWPVGLALLAYMIWSKKMFSKNCTRRTRSTHHGISALKPSGNSAFDAYKTETLRRLEDEQEQFEAFLQRLREAKDKSEFDAFMEDRAERAAAPAQADPEADHPKA